jgi:hypothetical protein
MKTKSLLPGIVLVLLAAAVWWLWRPQTITLEDGTKLKLVAVTYGKHHHFPGTKTPARAGRQNPAFDTTNDTLWVWVEQKHKGNNLPNYEIYAYDKSATACVGCSLTVAGQIRQGDGMFGYRFDAFPRRQGKVYLRVQEWNPQNVRQKVKKGFVISNPARGHFPVWLPNPLPNTQEDDDLSVTLNRLEFGAKTPDTRNSEAQNDPMNQGVLAAFQFQQNGKTATNWLPEQVETSDATGNHILGWCNSHWENDEAVTFYQYGLWPYEPAWKLRVEFSRTSGFHDDELWTVQEVPIQAGSRQDFENYERSGTNSAFAETTLNGIHLKLFPAKQFTGQLPSPGQIEGGLEIQADPTLHGMRLTLVKGTDEQGRDLRPMNWSQDGNYYQFALRKLGNARSLTLTLALHRSRFVEFTAKPTKQ